MKFKVFVSWDTSDSQENNREYTEDDFVKIMELPCLPPVGATLWISPDPDETSDRYEVEEIQFWQGDDFYEIHCQMVVVPSSRADDFRKRMLDGGWKQEA